MDTELFKEWFQAFSQAAGITLHVWKIFMEIIVTTLLSLVLKDLARSLRTALEMDPRNKKSNSFDQRFFINLMNVTIVDYNSGNISSVINSFKEVAKDKVKYRNYF